MHQNVQAEWKELDFWVFLDGVQYRMILQADFVKIVLFGTQWRILIFPNISNNLRVWAVHDLIGAKQFQGANVVSSFEPLAYGHFVILINQLLGKVKRLFHDFYLLGIEGRQLL